MLAARRNCSNRFLGTNVHQVYFEVRILFVTKPRFACRPNSFALLCLVAGGEGGGRLKRTFLPPGGAWRCLIEVVVVVERRKEVVVGVAVLLVTVGWCDVPEDKERP